MTNPAEPSAAPVGFSLTVPESWFEIDVRPGSRDSSIKSLVAKRVRQHRELREQRAAIVRLLQDLARRARDSGAVYCAGFVEPSADGPVTGSVAVSTVPGPLDAATDDPDRAAGLASRLTPKPARDDDDTWTSVTVTELPGAGAAARSFGVEDVEMPDGAGWVRVVTMQTFVPIPDDRRVAIISAASPVVPLADVLHDLFDAITETFKLVDEHGNDLYPPP